jgi:hypothetical protein
MRRQSFLLVPALATLTCAILADCSAGGTSRAARHTTAPSPRPAASSPQAIGRIGSPGNPLLLSCAQEAFPGYPGPPVPSHPRPEDLAIGPLYLANGRIAAAQTPAQYGYAPYGRNGRSYKLALVVTMGSTATMTIAPPARGHVVIDNPSAQNRGLGGVTSITYHSCPHKQGFFAQGFAFTHPPARGCVAPRCDDRQPAPHPPRHPVAVRRIVPTLTFVALAALPIEYETINQAAHNA